MSAQQQPEAYPRRILLAVTGLSPQVVTETLYALAVAKQPSYIPTEVHIVTTAEGAERARLSLLHEKTGWFHLLCREYGLEGIRFDPSDIHVLVGVDGDKLGDIRLPEDNERAADLITERIRELTMDETSSLHVSIAGGRKTMGFYAGYALSLYGREQDRLSHVLINAPYESHPDFYYPSKESRVIYTPGPDSRPLDTREARVTLAEIPFVRLRHGLPEALRNGETSFSATVAAAQRALGPAELKIDLVQRSVIAGGEDINLSPVELAFYGWLAERRKTGEKLLACPRDGVPEPEYAREFLERYRRVIGEMGDDERTAAALARGMDKNFFERRKSGVNARLRARLGVAAQPYLIRRFGKRPYWRHGLDLGAGQIEISNGVNG